MTRLSGPEFKTWQDAFNDAFSQADDLNTLVRRVQGKTLDQLAPAGDLPARIDAVLADAADKDWLEALLEGACNVRAGNQLLNRLREQVRAVSAIDPSDCFEAIRLVGQPMVNRRQLRDYVKQLDGGSSSNILIVDGDASSGKTYSSRFISFLANKRGTFEVVRVDLERLAKGENGPVKPSSVAQAIVNQLRLVNMPVPGQEQDSAWVDLFCDWLTGELRDRRTNCWIVVDGFRKALLAQGTHDLIEQLGMRSYENLPMVRLVLLSYAKRDDLEQAVRANVDYEWIGPISRQELLTGLTKYFSAVFMERQLRWGRPTDDAAELQPLVIQSVTSVLEKVKEGDPQRLLALSRATAEELRRITSVAAPEPSETQH